jgi:hypothetical protein
MHEVAPRKDGVDAAQEHKFRRQYSLFIKTMVQELKL